ncbi:hypothetical protein AO825_11675 [Pectobacterium brasiliense]|uniref:glycosyltransferase family 2 protein n=1 Tax=Pectobacterium brasiliense TaxID=180957 RepID=UPI0001A43034|nr:glycosyltransferase family 2 protein [Pectobacterium brasiliense]KGA24613.1 hypothetical protein KS44_04665 [Pectobacterium brasiliense]KRF61589.1 hypothetical protein AO825_11675 [Pectobacterium brasiliense]MBN3185752.1 glycosyltransferase family 2 protein [Pectobacterium brasiliense]QHG26602.1 glycosyltransferase [Pectobacterium brasiliense]
MSSLNNEKIVLSIIIPVYNVEEYVHECLYSIISSVGSKNKSKVEVIIVNDGSTDSSYKSIFPFLSNYSFVKYFEKENGGLSDARNYGLDNAKGYFICFIDSDDFVKETFVNDIIDVIGNYYFDVFSFRYTKCYSDKNTVVFDEFDKKDILNVNKDFYSKQPVFAWNKILRREIVANARFTKGLFFEDVALIPKLIDRSEILLHYNKSLYAYRQRSGAITSFQDDKYLDILRGVKSLWDNSQSDYIKTIIINQFFTLTLLSMRLPLGKYFKNMKYIATFYRENFSFPIPDYYYSIKSIPFRLLGLLGNKMIFLGVFLKPFISLHLFIKKRKSA